MLSGTQDLTSIELFVGAGGLAMGTAFVGFRHAVVIEKDRETCLTLATNIARGIEPLARWNLIEGDVRAIQYRELAIEPDIVAGGPPCQPFSICGKHRGHTDQRDMWPEAVRAVRELRPRAFIFENVKGLLRESFSKYFEYILLQLSHPEIVRRVDEEWPGHLSRLERHHTSRISHGLAYNVVFRLLNAANYGVPQKRERVFLVGFRSDLNAKWSFPEPTHTLEALLRSQWVTGEYWDRHRIAVPERPEPPPNHRFAVSRAGSSASLFMDKPWRTTRDAIGDLPDPESSAEARLIPNHVFNPGARQYVGHTGSPLDEPAKTLKAGDHGVPGGENMLVRADGSVRYFTVRESARLQTFPDHYIFPRSWTESMRQLGNAVPVTMGTAVAGAVAESLRKLPR
jgi:DNA (cytosine-5)-methyltransferase 1